MSAQKGKDLLLKAADGEGGFTTVAGLRTRQIAFNAETVDVTHAESAGRWRELLEGAGVRRSSISGSGIFKDVASDVLVRQLSNTQCIEGRNWGSSNGSVWVDNGCRAEFAEGRGGWGGGNTGNGQTIRCESNDNRQRVCRTDWRSATLVRQLSKSQCVEGRNWGSSNGAVWVSDGCRAEFAEGRGGGWGGGNGNWGGSSNYSIECSSDDNRMRSCAWERRQGRPVLIQQLSKTQCVEGRNWGYSGNSLWVNGGCRARFGAR